MMNTAPAATCLTAAAPRTATGKATASKRRRCTRSANSPGKRGDASESFAFD